MASLFQSERVLYLCSCNSFKPIYKTYFCRHCLKLRCGDCVSHEVDSHYCPNCLENMPSAEARLKKNRCANCFDCPSCKHTLSTRATSIQIPNPEDNSKTIPKKVYYLACGFCRWTSRDVGLKDQNIASGGWQELENPHSKRINSLLEHYRATAQQEKIEKERKKFTRRRNFVSYMEKYGMSSAVVRKQARLIPSLTNLSMKDTDSKMVELSPAEASDDVEPFPLELLEKSVNLPSVCTIPQRLSQPEFQPNSTIELYPRHKHLLSKRSQRCRECEHNLSKAELNPVSIKFKIQLAAFYHVPEIRIGSIPLLIPEKKNQVVMTITNPTQNTMHLYLKSLLPDSDTTLSGVLELPSVELYIAPRDDTAEFDDFNENGSYKDDPRVIAFRKTNKLGIFVHLTPIVKKGRVDAGLILKYDYLNTMPQTQIELKEPQITWLEHNLYINFGEIQDAEQTT